MDCIEARFYVGQDADAAADAASRVWFRDCCASTRRIVDEAAGALAASDASAPANRAGGRVLEVRLRIGECEWLPILEASPAAMEELGRRGVSLRFSLLRGGIEVPAPPEGAIPDGEWLVSACFCISGLGFSPEEAGRAVGLCADRARGVEEWPEVSKRQGLARAEWSLEERSDSLSSTAPLFESLASRLRGRERAIGLFCAERGATCSIVSNATGSGGMFPCLEVESGAMRTFAELAAELSFDPLLL